MKLIIYTCECLLDHLVRMTEDEIEKYIMNHVMFSLSDRWLMYIHLHDKILFFCLRCLNIMRPFIMERIYCIKRSGFFDDTCLDLIELSGLNNTCQNCLEILAIKFKKFLVKVKKKELETSIFANVLDLKMKFIKKLMMKFHMKFLTILQIIRFLLE